jgi:hypothetical protein
MLDSYFFPYVCPSKHFPFSESLVYLQVVMSHPDLHHDEKCLWVWLASRWTNQPHHKCSYTYEQLSQALNLPTRKVHSALFRLKLMGFLKGEISIWYGDLTFNMITESRKLEPLFLTQRDVDRQQEIKRQFENVQFIRKNV